MSTSLNTSSTPQQTDLRSGLAETNRRFESLFNNGDPSAAAQAVYTRDARVLPPGAPEVQGRDNIAQFWAAAAQGLGLKSVELSTVELHALGDGAYEIGRATLGLAGGQSATAKYVVIWRQENGQWRWHVDIWNMDGA